MALDTETTGKDFLKDGREYGIGISIACAHGSEYYGILHPAGGNVSAEVYDLLAAVIEDRRELAFQNAKFDLHSLRTMGVYVSRETFLYDAATMANLIDENVWEHRAMTLDDMAKHYLKSEGKVVDPYVEKEKKTGNQHILPSEEREYARVDAELTLELVKYLIAALEAEGLTGIWRIKEQVMWLLFKMECRGIRVNQAKAREQVEIGRSRMTELLKAIGITAMSNKQLKALLLDELHLPVFKLTKTGNPSFDKDTMPYYDALLEQMDSPLAKQISEYRGWQKAVTAAFEPYLERVSPDGRLRTSFNMHRTVTGRLSSSEPNLQQVPKEGDKPWKQGTKECFIPEDGYVLVNADFSQLELRLGTVYARDQILIDIFENPERDLFSEMAEELGMERSAVKTMVYALNYGAGYRKIAKQLGVSEAVAKIRIANYFKAYPGFKKMMDTCIAQIEVNKEIPLWSGRKRHMPPKWNPEKKRMESSSYKGWNSLIQGGAADIVERVMLALEREIDDDEKCRMLLQVHDAVVFEIREDLVDHYIPEIHRIMEDIVGATGEEEFGLVRFTVDAHPDYGSKGWELAA